MICRAAFHAAEQGTEARGLGFCALAWGEKVALLGRVLPGGSQAMGFIFGSPSMPGSRVRGRDGCGVWRRRWLGPGSSGSRLFALPLLQNVPPAPPQLRPRTTDSAGLPLRITLLVSSCLVWQGCGCGSALVPRGVESGDIMDFGWAWEKIQEFGTRGESLEQLEGNASSTDTQFLFLL